MPKPMDMFDDQKPDTPDTDVAGVEYTSDELHILVAGFQGVFWELYSRIPAKMQRQDVEDSLGTNAATDPESLYRAKGSYLALGQLKEVPRIALQVLSDLRESKKNT